ncbi:MAG: MgtC/SapB family protein [Xanthomonadales bacterium]|nr:MgtC/SapB family protein [Xanthomonadales bacterium]
MFDWIQSDIVPQLSAAVQVAIATVLGGIVGLERELANRPAGLRTHAMLGGAAALLVLLTENIVFEVLADTGSSTLRADPLRMVEAIVVGVSFLGAGTIFRSGERGIVGLTTGTSLLLVGGIGIAVAVGMLYLALIVTALALVLLRVLWRFEAKQESR